MHLRVAADDALHEGCAGTRQPDDEDRPFVREIGVFDLDLGKPCDDLRHHRAVVLGAVVAPGAFEAVAFREMPPAQGRVAKVLMGFGERKVQDDRCAGSRRRVGQRRL
jgi:hypothetical protein